MEFHGVRVSLRGLWRYDDQASRQLLDKVSCAQHLGRDQEDVLEAGEENKHQKPLKITSKPRFGLVCNGFQGLLKKFADPNYTDRR